MMQVPQESTDWTVKLQLAKKGDADTIQQLRKTFFLDKLINKSINLQQLITQAQIKTISVDKFYGSYELYSQVPIFLLIKGSVDVVCINPQGDNQVISQYTAPNLVYIQKSRLEAIFGTDNAAIVTRFELYAKRQSQFIQLPLKIKQFGESKLQVQQQPNTVTLREEVIMKKHMIFSLKNILKRTVSAEMQVGKNEPFYLLEGRACLYYDGSNDKYMLSCYEEGYFQASLLEHHGIKLHAFVGSTILTLEADFLKDQYIAALYEKRKEHCLSLHECYRTMQNQEKQKRQTNLMKFYNLNVKEVEKQIYRIEHASVVEPLNKKNNLPLENKKQTTVKQKCGIRIRKTKRIL